jgi:hypothetical protein
MVYRLALAVIFCISFCFAQTNHKVKPGTPTYRAIVLAAKSEFQKSAAYPIKTPGGKVLRAGDWAYVEDILAFVNPKHIGDGDGTALLKLKKGKWVVIEAVVGSGGMENLGAEWTKKYKLPKGFID